VIERLLTAADCLCRLPLQRRQPDN